MKSMKTKLLRWKVYVATAKQQTPPLPQIFCVAMTYLSNMLFIYTRQNMELTIRYKVAC